MYKFKNRSLGVLVAGISSTDTTCTLQSGYISNFINPAVDGSFEAQIYRADLGSPSLAAAAGECEHVLVTSVSGNELTITRAQKGDTAKNLNTSGKTYYIVAGPSAEFFNDVIAKLPETDFNNIEFGDVWGAGISLCLPELIPTEIVPKTGCYDKTVGNANYGNYACVIDNSQMVYIAACCYKYDADNTRDIQPMKKFNYDLTAAEDAGYVVFRDFINAGKLVKGKFFDKVDWSLTNFELNVSGIASSIIGGNPISSSSESKRDGSNNYAGSFSNCKSNSQSPADYYYGAIAVSKSRGNNFYPVTLFGWDLLASIAQCHGEKATSTTYCAWYDAAGVKNYPKGNNNYGADYNDNTVTFSACDDGYWASRNEARKTGGANNLAKTAHNGQTCGIYDVQGNQWKTGLGMTCTATSKNITAITRAAEAVFTIAGHGLGTGQIVMVSGSDTTEWNNLLQYLFADVEVIDPDTFKLKKRTNDANNGAYVNTSVLSADYDGSGLTCVTGTFYILKESANIINITGGNTLATDHWGATGIAANFDTIDLSAILINKYTSDKFGSGTNQVFGMSTDRTSNVYKLTSLGLPASGSSISSSGTNKFGQDAFYKFIIDSLCARVSGSWDDTSTAGVRYRYLTSNRAYSYRGVSARSCLNCKDV